MNCNALDPFVYYYLQFWSGWGLGTTYEQSTKSSLQEGLLGGN
jgi:hypothetical protein